MEPTFFKDYVSGKKGEMELEGKLNV